MYFYMLIISYYVGAVTVLSATHHVAYMWTVKVNFSGWISVFIWL